jgi:hypothetical protein
MCRWSDRKRNEYAQNGCMIPKLQDRFWQTGSQVHCGLFTGITLAHRRLIDDRKRTIQTETLF